MARSKAPSGKPEKQGPASRSRWARITWDHLEAWSGTAAVIRGRDYQRAGHVRQLAITEVGDLLASVEGTRQYATTVSLSFGSTPSLDSTCTCFVGFRCKHAVAVVAAYIHALVEGQNVSIATDDDPRWRLLERVGDGPDSLADDDEIISDPLPVRQAAARMTPGTRSKDSSDASIRTLLQSKSREELVELAWSLIRRFPAAYQEFRDQIAVADGNITELLTEARREVDNATSEFAYGTRSRNGRGGVPNFERIEQQLAQLLKLGQADEVVTLGRDLITEGIERIAEQTDEGDEFEELKPCFPIIRRAVLESSLSGLDRLRFAVDAEIADGYDVLDGAMTPIFAAAEPDDWSELADHLAIRLEQGATPRERDGHGREQITRWLTRALNEAGRAGDVQTVYEREAQQIGRYDTLVAHLITQNRLDDAERWASIGIAARADKFPGDAALLAEKLYAIADKRKQWDVAAAFVAHDYFANPSQQRFERLVKAADKAKLADSVRAVALSFLETGTPPFRVERAPRPATKSPRGKGRSAQPAPVAGGPPTDRVLIADDWPLPVPDALIPFLKRRDPMVVSSGPHFDVLLQMALAARNPDQILLIYDKMRAAPNYSRDFSLTTAYADSIADATAATHPDRAIAILTDRLNARLPQAEKVAYEASIGYLKKLRPLYAAVDRAADWDALVASIREQYRNRSRFLELLDRLEPLTIASSARRRSK